ncbi:MAG TPA: THUMP domain-containing protein [Burkholderiales bacterium]|nr:THUMP domain-containing protein [Burkholderiales bacterium]
MMPTWNFFAPCPRGLETVLAQELQELNAAQIRTANGGVHFSGDFRLCYAVNLQSRIASRVLWQVAHERYHNEKDIYQIASAVPWETYFDPALTIRVKVEALRCPLKSLDFVTLRIKDAVCDVFRAHSGKRPSVDTSEPDMRIHAFLDAHNITLYLDTTGEPLFKRGLRKQTMDAPLRENLAAGILRLSGWSPAITLFDPMCGSGTFLLEAALISLDIAPGAQRHFAFEKLQNFDARSWKQLSDQCIKRQKPKVSLPIYGSDLYGRALDTTRANLAAAGLAGTVQLKQANMLEISAPAPQGILVTNPPYGQRTGESGALAEFYPRLGDMLKKKFPGWKVYLFSADAQLPKLIGLAASKRTPLYNGALECRLFEYKIVAGSMRREKRKV